MRRKLVVGNAYSYCISVHVRHGDKWVEAQVFDDSTYLDAVKDVAFKVPSLSKRIFVSTEDPETVKYFSNLLSDGWNVSYTKVPWKPDRWGHC
jgi:hypothetical protein